MTWGMAAMSPRSAVVSVPSAGTSPRVRLKACSAALPCGVPHACTLAEGITIDGKQPINRSASLTPAVFNRDEAFDGMTRAAGCDVSPAISARKSTHAVGGLTRRVNTRSDLHRSCGADFQDIVEVVP